MNDTEFKTIANKMIEEQIQAREIACEQLIEEAGETISRLYELIKQCKKAKNASPLYYPTIDVESVADRVERLYRFASNVESKTYLLNQLSNTVEDIDIEEHSN